MKVFYLRKNVAFNQISLGAADLIRAIAQDEKAMAEPYMADGRQFFRYVVTDPKTGAALILALPAIDDYFVETDEPDQGQA